MAAMDDMALQELLSEWKFHNGSQAPCPVSSEAWGLRG